jgi:hypothetical protein
LRTTPAFEQIADANARRLRIERRLHLVENGVGGRELALQAEGARELRRRLVRLARSRRGLRERAAKPRFGNRRRTEVPQRIEPGRKIVGGRRAHRRHERREGEERRGRRTRGADHHVLTPLRRARARASAASTAALRAASASASRGVAARSAGRSCARESAFAREETLTCFARIRRRPGARGRTQRDAVDRAGRDAELAAGAQRRKHGMHALGPTDDRVDRTRGDAQRAADAGRFIDLREHQRPLAAAGRVEWRRRVSGQCRPARRSSSRHPADSG